MTITDIDHKDESIKVSQSDDALQVSSNRDEKLESTEQVLIDAENPGDQPVSQITSKPIDESNSRAIWVAMVTLAIVFYFIRRIISQSSRRGRRTPLLPSHEQLRRLREARLAAYDAKKDSDQQQTDDDDKVKLSESVNSSFTKESKAHELPAAARETSIKEQTLVNEQQQPHQQRLRRPVLKSIPPRKWEPIKSAVDLLNWTSHNLPLGSKLVPLQPRELQGPKKLLLVHDMAGNYAEDAFMDGWFARSKDNDNWVWGFRPSHLIWVDIFVYFSHNLVSIPPKTWIDCCHRHGSKVLGTFLTEWEAGEKFCAELFSTKSTALQVADKLRDIALNLGFDGWLINIENRLSLEMVSNMKVFLAALSSKNNMSVIWYDSVISRTGELKWQNGLNDENVEFFVQVNDGILTNYGWGEQKLMTSHATARAVGRSSDFVWHGIDVFGRGTFGGGGMSCDKALNLIDRMDGSSACLFAPGWVLENAAERNPTKGRQTEHTFFHKLLFNTAWGETPPSISLDLTKKGLFTDFCDGGGSQYYSDGLKLSSRPWLHLSRQRLQPRFDIITPDEELDVVAQRRVTIRCVETGLAYSGSCAIQMVGRRSGLTSEDWCFFPILSLSSRLGGERGPASILRVVAAFHMAHGDAALGIQVAARDKTKGPSRLVLVPPSCQKEGTLPAVYEKMIHGWAVRTWELRTYELRGRNLTGVTLSPLPMPTGTVAATWVDVRLGFVSLDETLIEVSECCPQNVTLDKTSHCLSWTCACGREDTCAIDHVVITVNGSFRQCAEARGTVQVNDLAITTLGVLEDVVAVRACFWNGCFSDEIVAESGK